MDKEFWTQRWLNQQTGFHQQDINQYLVAHWQQLGIQPGSRVLVPLCGKSLDMIWLRDQGFHVIGVELSEIAVKAFFQENGLDYQFQQLDQSGCYQAPGITIFQGDFFDLQADMLNDIDAVFDRASMVALPESMRVDYVSHLLALSGKAPILLISLEYEQTEMSGPPFAVSESEIRQLFNTSSKQVIHLLTENLLELEPRFKQKGLSRLDEIVYKIVAPTI